MMTQGSIPLNLAVLEVRFPGDPLVETLRGEFYQKMRGDFPKLFVPNPVPNRAPALQPYQFASEDGSRWLLVALNAFAYGVSGSAYEGFATFKGGWERYFNTFREIYSSAPGMTRMGLRYINHLPIERDVKNAIKSATVLLPEISLKISKLPTRNSLFVTEKAVEDGFLRVVINTEQEGLNINQAVLDFDFSFRAESSSPIPFDELGVRLETAHDVTKDFFRELVSEEYRKGVGLE